MNPDRKNTGITLREVRTFDNQRKEAPYLVKAFTATNRSQVSEAMNEGRVFSDRSRELATGSIKKR